METKFTEQQGIQVIQDMIENTKAKFQDNGFQHQQLSIL